MDKKLKVCFLFNHYFPHQVPHAAPYAFELSRKYNNLDIVIACSTQQELNLARKIGKFYPGHKCYFWKMDIPQWYKVLDPIISKWSLYRKRLVLKKNLSIFKSFDALVAPERHCSLLKTKYGLENLKMIHIRHGAGDRLGGFDQKLEIFDLVLVPGPKIIDHLKRLRFYQRAPHKYKIAGYPKFEVVKKLHPIRPKIFNNENITVVYNPHFDQRVASWNKWGLKILEFFAQHPEYNLIFAPHVVLFQRRLRHRACKIPEKYFNFPNIHIDLGSIASVDMTYTLAADIYIGDVSSQVYEFLWKPRPCIFLNSHQIKWKNNPFYLHWSLGQVIENFEKDFYKALKLAFKLQPQFEPKQKALFNYTFYTEPNTTAAERGAKIIYKFLENF